MPGVETETVIDAGAALRLLRVPLATKLAGANLLIVALAWIAAYAGHDGGSRWEMLSVVTVALAVGLVVNLVLVTIALRPIRDLERTATRVWAGDLEARVPESAVADANLEQVGGTLNYLLGALAEDRAQVRALASEVVRSGDRARARVGKELHDSVAQSLAALRYQLIAIEQDTTDPDLIEQLQAVRLAAGEILEHVRLLSHDVHPQILDDLGLVPALKHLARTSKGPPAISVTVTDGSEGDLRQIPSDAAAVLYRVAQEAVLNAIRHANASRIDVRIGLAGENVAMRVDDDGTGFDAAATGRQHPTMGIFTMRERTMLAHGTFEIVSQPRGGTSVRVTIPIIATAAPSSVQTIAGRPSSSERRHAG